MMVLDTIFDEFDDNGPMTEYVKVQDVIDICKECTQDLWDHHIKLAEQFTKTTDDRILNDLHEQFKEEQQEIFIWRYYIPEILKYVAKRVHDGEI